MSVTVDDIMSKVNFALFVLGIAVWAAGCRQRPGDDPRRVTRNAKHAETDQPEPDIEEATRALVEFEKGITSGSKSESLSAVYALDKYVRKHAIVVEQLLKMLRGHEYPALRGAAARIRALTADGGKQPAHALQFFPFVGKRFGSTSRIRPGLVRSTSGRRDTHCHRRRQRQILHRRRSLAVKHQRAPTRLSICRR